MHGRPLGLSRREWLIGAGGLVGFGVFSLLVTERTTLTPDLSLPVARTELKPFSATNLSGLYAPRGLLGEGTYRTVYEMPARTSKARAPSAGTNQLFLIRTAGISAATLTSDPEIGEFSLVGTRQEHLYNGLQVGYSEGAYVHDITIANVPGDAPSPPGETFALSLWHANNSLVERVTIDGGTVAASLFGINSCDTVRVVDYIGHNSIYGMGIAIWDSANVHLVDPDLSHCRHPINVEQAHPGTMRFTRPNLTEQRGAGPPVTVNSALGSTVVLIEDPVVDRWPLQVGVAPRGTEGLHGTRTQDPADIHLVLDGVDVSADETRLQVGY